MLMPVDEQTLKMMELYPDNTILQILSWTLQRRLFKEFIWHCCDIAGDSDGYDGTRMKLRVIPASDL